MSKRKAATELNHENWNREEEPEVAGKFQEAPKEVVQGRVIRTANRRLKAGASASPGGEISNEPKKLFSGFTGFGPMKSSATPTSVSEIAKNSFSFLKKSDTPLKTSSAESKQGDKMIANEMNEKYLAKLKGLNEAVLDWIKQHVESNPCCILTPIFRDYDNYLKEIQSEKDSSSSTSVQKTNSAGFRFDSDSGKQTQAFPKSSSNNSDKTPAANASMFSFGPNSSEKTSVPTFSFGSKEASDKTTVPTNSLGNKDSSNKLLNPSFPEKKSPPVFLFGSPNKDSAPAAPPSFGLIKNTSAASDASSGPPEKKSFFNFGNPTEKSSLNINFPSAPPGGNFTFGILNKPAESGGNAESEGGDDQEDPQPEPNKPATEKDAIYTQRVKLFVKKESNYSDLGVGNLFIKEAPNGRYQAIVRHDTSIGNIILNILLSSQHPTKRLGKNNVMIVCQPTPQHTGPAVPVLLRVKTSEDADQLLETIEKYKKK